MEIIKDIFRLVRWSNLLFLAALVWLMEKWVAVPILNAAAFGEQLPWYILMESKQVMAQGGIEKIGLPDSFLLVKLPNGEKVKFEKSMPEHTVGIELILEKLVDPKIGCIKDLKEINAVGHRVVHGGEKFNKSVLITPEVKAEIIQCVELAPLHNPANLKGIDAIEKILPGVPQVAVFDTAFHQRYHALDPTHR